MKKNLTTLIAGIFVIGPLYGVMLYLIDDKVEFDNLIMYSLLFGIGMALGEIFIFEKIRNRKKEK